MTSDPAPETTGGTLGTVVYLLSAVGAAIALLLWAGGSVWHPWGQHAGTAAPQMRAVRTAPTVAAQASTPALAPAAAAAAPWLGDDSPAVDLVESPDQATVLQSAIDDADAIRHQYELAPLDITVRAVSADERSLALVAIAKQNELRAVSGLPPIIVHDLTGSAGGAP